MKEYGKTIVNSALSGLVVGVAYMAAIKLWEDVLEDKFDDLEDYLTEKFSKK